MSNDSDADEHRKQRARRRERVDVDQCGDDHDGDRRGARRHDCPRRAFVRAGVDSDEEQPEAERGDDSQARSGRDARAAGRAPARVESDAMPADDECDPEPLQRTRARLRGRRRRRAARPAPQPRWARRFPSRRSRGRGRERRDADQRRDSRTCGGQRASTTRETRLRRDAHPDEDPARPTACETTSTVSTARRRAASPPRKSPTPQHRAPASASSAAT